MALGLARHKADERLLHDPGLRDAMGKNAEEAHAALGPQVAADARLDARLDQAHEEVATERLALQPEQRELLLHRLAAWELVAQPRLAQLEDPREEGLELVVLDDRLRASALRDS